MYININAKSPEELAKRIADNEKRGWTLKKSGQGESHYRDYDYSESERGYVFRGVDSYKKFTAVMYKDDECRVNNQ